MCRHFFIEMGVLTFLIVALMLSIVVLRKRNPRGEITTAAGAPA